MSSGPEPPEKKLKMIENVDNIYIDTIDKCIEQIINSETNLQPIISNDFYQPPPLINVFVGHIKNVKDISRTILLLNEKIPLKELSHLKRVCRRDIILCPTTFLDTYSIQDYIENHVPELKDNFEYFKEINVPSLPPKVTKQYNEARKIWSCNFHPNEYYEKLVSGNFFTLDDLKLHRKFMEVVFEVAKWYALHKGTNFDSNDIFQNVNITVVVNPISNQIVTIAYDNRQDHPMQHSAMLAIDNVAKTQNGGVWTSEKDNNILPGIDEELIHHLKNKFSQFIVGVKKPMVKTDLHKAGGVKALEGKGHPKTDLQKEYCEKDGPYLCTGYYIYMLKEPCVMCAMGLVHARVKCVFFSLNNNVCGGLSSVTKLQTVPSLNHHFEVFTGFLSFPVYLS